MQTGDQYLAHERSYGKYIVDNELTVSFDLT